MRRSPSCSAAISHGLKALTDHPDQRARWFGDYQTHARTAVEELVRWASPVLHFRRTVTAPTELAGVSLAAGDKVVMFYDSANRDERVYERPDEFDITRANARDQVAFGGGQHFCLGAALARLEGGVVLPTMVRRFPDLAPVEATPTFEPRLVLRGVTHLPVTV